MFRDMPDFGPNWKWARDLREGGQAHTFVVKRVADSDGREYVLKRLKNLKRVQRFEREIEACIGLDHPNVLRLIDYDNDPDGKPFLVTEYCEGGSLADKSRPFGTVLEILEIFRQICAGAAYAQERDIVHRDIKPDNIFFHKDGTAVLGDFGICFIDDDGTRVTATEEVAGSRWYCAPELRDGRLDSNVPAKAADVYSLGKVLYWMLSGQVFDRENHRDDRFRLGQHDPDAPEYELVNQLLDAAIVADPFQRVLGAEQLLGRVDGLISVVRAGGHPITLKIPHRCLFCAQGQYEVTVDGTKPGVQGNQTLQQIGVQRARQLFGFSAIDAANWIIFVCQACGNVQVFRPDLTPGALKKWQGKIG